MIDFVHLHLHSEYSLLDGAIKLKELFEYCDSIGQKAVAITDHGNMFAALKFIKQACKYTDASIDPYDFLKEKRKFKVKPIIGCEVYVANNMKDHDNSKSNHLILLAKNKIGYKNLVKIVSYGYLEGFYYKPRIDFELLKQYNQGLICLSACLAGEIPQFLLKNERDKALERANKYKKLFGKDYYIEIQNHGLEEQKRVLSDLISLAKELDIELVATNDAHYLKKDESAMQKILQCIAFRTSIKNNTNNYFPTNEFYVKTGEEMNALFKEYKNAISNTVKIADQCECDYFSRGKLFPKYKNNNAKDLIKEMTYKGLQKKYVTITDEIKKRAEYELDIIISLGFADYYLVVWDFIHFAEDNDIPVGPGRGSGVGSIVAYAIGITKVDPLKYNLIFERFLNKERISNPDFDIDFCVEKRDKVIDYVIEKYGKFNVAQIITFGTLASKAAIKDVGRVFSLPFSQVNKLTDSMENLNRRTIKEYINATDLPPNNFFLETYKNDPDTKEIVDMAIKIENMPRQTGIHAAGVILSNEKIYNYLPLYRSSDNGIITTQFDMIECEELGMLKMDFLGLRTLTDIKYALKLIEKKYGKKINFYEMEYDDKNVFDMIGKGDTHAVFQLESEGMKKFMKELKPTNMEDIIAGISLYRPGPMDYIKDYVKNKNEPNAIVYEHPLLEKILEVTYGIIVYQEQVMQIVRELGGYTYGRADIVRRMMSKKKSAEMEKEKQIFIYGIHEKGFNIDGALKRGVSREIAENIFEKMISFARYAFNKSHAAAYAYVTYQTAYLKHYYFLEYICAVLNNRINSLDEISNYLNFVIDKGYTILSPDINKSDVCFSCEENKLRVGLAAIKNVGTNIIENIIEDRKQNGEFINFENFIKRKADIGLNKKMLEALILSGAFDCFNETRATLMQNYTIILNKVMQMKKKQLENQLSMFDMIEKEDNDYYIMQHISEFSIDEKLKYEKEMMGVYISGHPLDAYRKQLNKFEYNSRSFNEDSNNLIGQNISIMGILRDCKIKISKNSAEYGIGKLEDLHGIIELFLPPKNISYNKSFWVEDNIVIINGIISKRDGTKNLIVNQVEKPNKSNDTKMIMCIYLSFQNEYEILLKVKKILNSTKGNDDIYILDTDSKQKYKISNVKITKGLHIELIGVVRDKNQIKIINK